MKLSLSVLLIFLVSCASKKNVFDKDKYDDLINQLPPIQKLTIHPGFVRKLEIEIPSNEIQLSKLVCAEKEVRFYIDINKLISYVPKSYFSKSTGFECHVEGTILNKAFKKKMAEFIVRPYDYPKERLYVDKKRVFLNKKDLARVIKEKKILDKVYESSSNRPLFSEPFSRPLNSKITSFYGTRRIYNNKKQGQHLGIDFRAAVGVPINTANSGRVAFTGDLFYTGNTVIVDHGLGIFTVYAHLSKILIDNGVAVNKNQLIGEAGATGRVSGPHLHWGVKIDGNWINGFSLESEGV